jgi:hypothetical protein
VSVSFVPKVDVSVIVVPFEVYVPVMSATFSQWMPVFGQPSVFEKTVADENVIEWAPSALVKVLPARLVEVRVHATSQVPPAISQCARPGITGQIGSHTSDDLQLASVVQVVPTAPPRDEDEAWEVSPVDSEAPGLAAHATRRSEETANANALLIARMAMPPLGVFHRSRRRERWGPWKRGVAGDVTKKTTRDD